MDTSHVKIKRAAALVPNITHLSDWDISLHGLYADRNSFDNRTIIDDELHDWVVGKQTTNVAFMIHGSGRRGGGRRHTPPTADASNLIAQDSGYQALSPFLRCERSRNEAQTPNAIGPKS